jgi:hypothetical protein
MHLYTSIYIYVHIYKHIYIYIYICIHIYRELSPLVNAIIQNDPNPLLVFINRKSGGRVGSTLLECTYMYVCIYTFT